MTLHKMLAGYWYRLADPGRDGSWRSNYTRAFSELPYHLVSSLKDAFLSHMFLGNLICNVYELQPVIAFYSYYLYHVLIPLTTRIFEL